MVSSAFPIFLLYHSRDSHVRLLVKIDVTFKSNRDIIRKRYRFEFASLFSLRDVLARCFRSTSRLADSSNSSKC